jgi:hypothetical protein
MFAVQEQLLQEHVLIPLSRKVADVIRAQPNHCAVNAWRALIELPDLFREEGYLVEGWMVIEEATQVALVEHVWCCLADGRIVDPSVLLLVSEHTPVWYFAGLRRTYAETEALEGELFPHVRFEGAYGADGLGHPGYKAAWSAARRKTYALALVHKPPKALQFQSVRRGEEPTASSTEEEAVLPIIEGGSLDLQRSLDTSRQIQAVPEQCWYNARQALLEMPHAFFTATYIEGWVVGVWSHAIRVSEHGWIWTPRDGIVDPSIVLGSVPRRLQYVPGIRLSWLDLQHYQTTRLPLAREGWPDQLSYQEACQKALERAEALAWETGLPMLIEPGGARTIRVVDGTLQFSEIAWDIPSHPSF